ncbi:unnamed protein product [Allacma fusca]|uniref:Transmembrane protein 134 n=1 Tax=Allacma fusca TaxID=39272 RepID=A0A8J2L0P9_9HEXA|nr:unnamed protein product [Allacma fusca]
MDKTFLLDMGSKRSPMFSIDDAFEEENTDAIRVYGATTTTERSPLKPKRVSSPAAISAVSSDGVAVHIQDPINPLSIKPIIRGITKLKSCDDTISKDSDSLITEGPENGYDPSMPWWQHPKVRENWKMVLAAFSLLLIGLGLSIAGIVIIGLPINGIQGTVFFIAGVICFIPGAYHVIYIYLAVKGKRGYDFYHLPLFN